jgi:hypothetical protein
MEKTNHIIEVLRQAPLGSREEFVATEDRVRISIRVADWDRLGCLFDGLKLEHIAGRPLLIDPAAIVERINYLGEQLAEIEHDPAGGRIILRSKPPRDENGLVSFFEMVIDRHEGLTLVRYEYDRHHHRRIAVSAPLTRETLERLLTDLTALAQDT